MSPLEINKTIIDGSSGSSGGGSADATATTSMTPYRVAIHSYHGDALTNELCVEAGDVLSVERVSGAWAYGRKLLQPNRARMMNKADRAAARKRDEEEEGVCVGGWFPSAYARPIPSFPCAPASDAGLQRCRSAPCRGNAPITRGVSRQQLQMECAASEAAASAACAATTPMKNMLGMTALQRERTFKATWCIQMTNILG